MTNPYKLCFKAITQKALVLMVEGNSKISSEIAVFIYALPSPRHLPVFCEWLCSHPPYFTLFNDYFRLVYRWCIHYAGEFIIPIQAGQTRVLY